MSNLVVVVSCDLANRRCCGYGCNIKFQRREDYFENYPADDTRFHILTCGGCCGGGLAMKLENLRKWMKRMGDKPDEIVLHFASCVCNTNHHKPACPNLSYMTEIAKRHGFDKIIMGTYRSKAAEKRRQEGIY